VSKSQENILGLKGSFDLTRKAWPPCLATTTADPSAVTDAEVVTTVAVAAGLLAMVASPPPNMITYTNLSERKCVRSRIYMDIQGAEGNIRKRTVPPELTRAYVPELTVKGVFKPPGTSMVVVYCCARQAGI
jgi:hypothetical protein